MKIGRLNWLIQRNVLHFKPAVSSVNLVRPPIILKSFSFSTEAPSYIEKEIADRGKGLVAIRKIMKGTLILVDSPLLVINDYHKQENVIRALDQTTREQKLSILDLFNPCSYDNDGDKDKNKNYNPSNDDKDDERKTLLNIFACNSLESFSSAQCGNLYMKLSRVNHSCIPNVIWSGTKEDWDKAELRACQNIQEGEELLASYLGTDHYDLRETRRETLRNSWGFHCNCQLCSLTGEKLKENEIIRKYIKALSENVQEFITNPHESAESAFSSAIERLDIISRHEDEMLEALLAGFIDCYILASFVEEDAEIYKQKALDLAKQLGDCYVRDCNAVILEMEKNADK